MKRKCQLLPGQVSADGKRAIFVDSENVKEILAYLNRDDRHKRKFRFMAQLILENHRKPDLYDKEDINERCRHVTAMKFFKGQENDRIYCKEVTTPQGTFVVVAAILHERKKSQKNSNREVTLIETVAGYEYDF